jgi:antitoxin component YwqK of YwqJK toxin-antitoxin module
MELEEIDRFNEEIERQRNLIQEENFDYEEEMDNMAFLYDMRDILNLANDCDKQDEILTQQKQKELQQQQMVYQLSKLNRTRSNKAMKNLNCMNYRKPKKLLQQPQSRHMLIRGTRSN